MAAPVRFTSVMTPPGSEGEVAGRREIMEFGVFIKQGFRIIPRDAELGIPRLQLDLAGLKFAEHPPRVGIAGARRGFVRPPGGLPCRPARPGAPAIRHLVQGADARPRAFTPVRNPV